jgi:hypothetical protein
MALHPVEHDVPSLLKFLVPLKASFLLFRGLVMGKDSSPEQSKIQAMNAANVDAITQRLEDQSLAQATLNDFDEVTKTFMKKSEFGVVTEEPHQALQGPRQLPWSPHAPGPTCPLRPALHHDEHPLLVNCWWRVTCEPHLPH